MKIKEFVTDTKNLLRKKNLDEWEIIGVKNILTSIGAQDDKINKFEHSQEYGLAVRILKQKNLGFSYTTKFDKNDIKKMINRAIDSSSINNLKYKTGFSSHISANKIKIYDENIKKENLNTKKQRVLKLVSTAKNTSPYVQKVHPAEINEQISEVFFSTSHNINAYFQKTLIAAFANVMVKREKDQEIASEYNISSFLKDINVEKIGENATKRAISYLKGRPVSDGKYEVILENRAASELLKLFSFSLLGDNIVKKRSLLNSKIGTKIISNLVSIKDNALNPKGIGTRPFDDEGTPSANNILINNGKLQGFLFDKMWGEIYGTKTTSNATRPNIKNPPKVDFNNLYITPGENTLKTLISHIKEGLLISELMGIHTANPITGDFSLGANGFFIKNGKISYPVKSITIAGQILKTFQSIKEVANDLKFLNKVNAPSLLISNVSISGPK